MDDGSVSIYSSWRNSWTFICNVNEEWKGIPPQTCWAWFAQLNSSIMENRPVIIAYNAYADVSACATIPAYGGAAAPMYVRMQKS